MPQKILLPKGGVYRFGRHAPVAKGKRYAAVRCKGCGKWEYFALAPPPNDDPHPVIGEGKISTPCRRCGHDTTYSSDEITVVEADESFEDLRPHRLEPSNMPRQPISKRYPNVTPTFGPGFLEGRPQAAALVARCIALWTEVETAEAHLLAVMLGANTEPSIALFLAIQNSRLQFTVVDAVAQVALNENDYELFCALMKYHASVEKDCNDLAHGCFGGSELIKEGVAWVNSVHFAQHQAKCALAGVTEETKSWIRARTFVYELGDLETIAREIENLHQQINFFRGYLQSRSGEAPATDQWREQRYKELCAEPRIAEAIAQQQKKAEKI